MDNKPIIDFLVSSGNLKWVQRQGWVREGMPEPETVAEHSWRVAILAWLLADILSADKEKLIKMALIHDLSEANTGDYVTERGDKVVTTHDFKPDEIYVKEVTTGFDKKSDLYSLWHEFHSWEKGHDQNKTVSNKNAELIYEIGKIATCWQALEYEQRGASAEVCDEWWINAKATMKNPILIEFINELSKKRQKK